MKHYYAVGWCSGTGGGISIRQGDRVFIAPSGVHKERLNEQDIYIIDRHDLQKIYYDPNLRHNEDGQPVQKLKISACQPLFSLAFNMRDAGAVIHSHSMYAMLCTLLDGEHSKEFRATHVEMIKGIAGHGYHDTLVVPIIDNVAHECDLEDSMRDIMEQYPNTFAVLVRRHGVYIWGKDIEQCKTHAECYHYLFEAAVKMKQLGVDIGSYADTKQ